MTTNAAVSIYAVNADGSTGERLGSAVLIHPGVAVASPPVPAAVSADPAPSLRVAVAFGAGAELTAQILEVTEIKTVPPQDGDDAAEPLVGLKLAGLTSAGLDVNDLPPDAPPADAVRAVRTLITPLPGTIPPLPGLGQPHGLPCKLFGWWCSPTPAAETLP